MSREPISKLLDKLVHWDKDERYMAISDIMSHLDAGKEVDTATESKITAAVLSRIEQDSSNDVRSLSVSLSTLVARVSVKQIVAMCNTLCNLLTAGDEGMRDVYLLGGKTVVKDAPHAAGPHVATTMSGFLLPALSNDDSSDALRCTVLDLYSDLFARFGGEVSKDHPVIVDALLQLLSSSNDAVRKRSSAALGHLAAFLDDELFGRAVARALTTVQENRSPRDVRTMIQVLATMSAGAGYRMGSYLSRAVPLLVRTLGDPDDESMEGEAGDESRETCFAALRSFAQRCPAAMAEYVDTVLDASRKFLAFDPNYQDEDDDEEGKEEGSPAMDEEEEEEEEDFVDEYEDLDFDEQDDDSSWKVRRAALLAISAIIESRPEALSRVYKECGISLAKRCKERELSVRHTVLQTLTQLLSTSVVEAQASSSGHHRAADGPVPHPPHVPAPLRRQRSIGGSLQELTPYLIKRVPDLIRHHASGGSIVLKIRGEALRVARELVNAVESGDDASVLQRDVTDLLPVILSQQGDSAPSVRLGVIRFVDAFLRAFPSVLSGPHAGDVVSAVCKGTRDDWFKVVAASLTCAAPLASAMRSGANATETHVSEVFTALRPWLESADTDQEVRDAAMATAGAAVASLGEAASCDAERILGLLVDRLSNESTRLSALRALHTVTVSPGAASLPLAPFAKPFFAATSSFFRMQDRNLRQYALQVSAAFAKHPTVRGALEHDAAAETAESLAAAVSGSDQYLAALAIQVAGALVKDVECPAEPIVDALVGPTLDLGTSGDAAAVTMDAVLPFLRATATATGRASELYARAVEPAAKAGTVSREASLNVARCGAALLAAMPASERDATIDGVVDTVRSAGGSGSGSGSESGHLIALATTGFAGLELPLDRHSDLFRLFLDAFARGSEDANAVAARALGCLAASEHNSAQCLPPLLDSLRRQEHVYHLLIALRGALGQHASVDTTETLPVVTQFLASGDENVQTVAAECTGHLLAQQPKPVLEELEKFASAEESPYRAAVCQAVRHAATLPDAASHERTLCDIVTGVLGLIKDPEVSVRMAALRALNSVAHHRPNLVSRHFEAAREEGVLANVAAETEVDPSLKKTVDLGPFKHKIDEGLPLRKAAFACLNTLLESVPEHVNVEVVMKCVLRGLSDVDDVQLQCHEILSRVARGWPAHIMSHLEALLQSPNGLALAVFKRKTRGPPPTGLELERMHDVVRSGLRALQSVGAIPGAADTRLYKGFIHRVAEDKTASSLLEEISR